MKSTPVAGTRTANTALALLHAIYEKARNKRWWSSGENPAHGVDRFKEISRDRFLQVDEPPRFFQALRDEPNETIRDYFLIALLTGARRSNTLAILEARKNNGSEWGFPAGGRAGHRMEPKMGWDHILQRAGIQNLLIHDLRRTLGSWQARTGASLAIIGKMPQPQEYPVHGHLCQAGSRSGARVGGTRDHSHAHSRWAENASRNSPGVVTSPRIAH